jgi:hypothetical protein
MRILSLLTLLMLVGCDDSLDTESPIAGAWLAQDEGRPYDGYREIQRHTVSFRRDGVYIETYDLVATDPSAVDVVAQGIGDWWPDGQMVYVSVEGHTRGKPWSVVGDALTLDGSGYVRLDESGVF